MALTESERIYLQGEKKENPGITSQELSVELSELRKEMGVSKLQGLSPLEKGRTKVGIDKSLGVKSEITPQQTESITPSKILPRFEGAREQFGKTSEKFGEGKFFAGVKEFGKGILEGTGELAESVGDLFPRAYMNLVDAVSKGQPGTAQFGSGIEFLQEAEDKSAEEMKQEFISEGATPEEADKALAVAVEEVERILNKQPARGQGLRETGGKLSVTLPASIATGGAAAKGAIGLGAKAGVGSVKARVGKAIARGAAGGLGAETGFTVAEEGRLPTPGEAGVSAVVGVAAETLFNAVKGGAKLVKKVFGKFGEGDMAVLNPNLNLSPSEIKLGGKELAALQKQRAAQFSKYVDIAESGVKDIKKSGAFASVEIEAEQALKKLNVIRQTRGATLGGMKETLSKKPVSGVGDIFTSFKNELRSSGARFSRGNLVSIPGRQSTFSSSDKKILKETFDRVDKLIRKGATLREADDVIIGAKNNIKAIKSELNILSATNAERIALKTLNQLDEAMKTAGGSEFKSAKASSKEIIEITDELNKLLGKGGKSEKTFLTKILTDRKTKDTANKIKELTGVDLNRNAHLAKLADGIFKKEAPLLVPTDVDPSLRGDFKGGLLESIKEGIDIRDPALIAKDVANKFTIPAKDVSKLSETIKTFIDAIKEISPATAAVSAKEGTIGRQ